MKGIVKKIIVLTLCMALVVGSFQTNVMAKRTPKPKLNKKNITIMMGKTSRLKLKNNKKKVKWRSLNKKIATVTKKGLVKGKSEGKTTIVAKVGKKKYKFTCHILNNINFFDFISGHTLIVLIKVINFSHISM